MVDEAKFAQVIKTIQVRNDRKFSKCNVTMDMHVQVCVSANTME